MAKQGGYGKRITLRTAKVRPPAASGEPPRPEQPAAAVDAESIPKTRGRKGVPKRRRSSDPAFKPPQNPTRRRRYQTALPPSLRKTWAEQQEAFLEAFIQTARINDAAKASGINPRQHYRWLDDSPGYPERFEQAFREATQTIEDEAVSRAVQGWDEPVYYKGAVVGYVRKKSDSILMFLLKGMRPERYKERVEHQGNLHQDSGIRLVGQGDLAQVLESMLAGQETAGVQIELRGIMAVEGQSVPVDGAEAIEGGEGEAHGAVEAGGRHSSGNAPANPD